MHVSSVLKRGSIRLQILGVQKLVFRQKEVAGFVVLDWE